MSSTGAANQLLVVRIEIHMGGNKVCLNWEFHGELPDTEFDLIEASFMTLWRLMGGKQIYFPKIGLSGQM